MSAFNQNVETTCNFKLKLTGLTEIFITEKLVKDNKNVCKKDNSKLINFSGPVNAITIKYYPRCYEVNDAKATENLCHKCSIVLHFMTAYHTYWFI